MTLLEPKPILGRFDPSLIVNRVRVERNGKAAYDEKFHVGVNVLRGDNSSGKSTILNFIFYGLGGDLTDWSDVAKLCTHVLIEVRLNGLVATLSREISESSQQSMDIFAGTMDDALEAPRAEWTRYPYRRSANAESFSQALFRLLNIPEVRGGVSETVTMHQCLRLLYADQLSPVEAIFKFEGFDPPTKREAIGRLLCGAYDNEMYENELKIRELSKQFDTTSGELRSFMAVLGRSGEGMSLSWIDSERAVLAQKRAALMTEIQEAEMRLFSHSQAEALTLKAQEAAYTRVQELQKRLVEKQRRLDQLDFAIADSNAFIAALDRKLRSLTDAKAVAEHIVDVHFDVCPACLAALMSQADTPEACHLCQTPFDSERQKGRMVALINDTALQLRQSQVLQLNRTAERERVSGEVRQLNMEWVSASEHLSSLTSKPTSEVQDVIRELNRRAGYIEREAEDLEKRASIALMVDDLSKKKASLQAEIIRLRDDNEARARGQQNALARAYKAIADEVRFLLHNDLPRQDSFISARNIEFDFGANQLAVDGHTYFSASSRVILKSSFFLGFLSAASKISSFRHPRFCIIDTVEDKGMEMARSHNFQHLIANASAAVDVEHQIIFATAMISPELDDERFTVGKYSTRSDPTLVYHVIDF